MEGMKTSCKTQFQVSEVISKVSLRHEVWLRKKSITRESD